MWSERDISRGATVRHGNNFLLPDVVSYSAVIIYAYAACVDQPYGIGRACKLLAELGGLAARQEVDESTTGGGATRRVDSGGATMAAWEEAGGTIRTGSVRTP